MYVRCLRFNRWPVHSPEELYLAEKKRQLSRLYGK